MFDDNGGSDREEGCDDVDDEVGQANDGDAGDEEEYDDDG